MTRRTLIIPALALASVAALLATHVDGGVSRRLVDQHYVAAAKPLPDAVTSPTSSDFYQVGGSQKAVALDGCVMWLAVGPRVERYDACIAGEPRLTAVSSVMNSVVGFLDLAGDRLYAVTTMGRAYLLEANSADLAIAGSVELPGYPMGIAGTLDRLYASLWTDGLAIVDATDPDGMVVQDRLLVGFSVRDVAVDGDTVYAVYGDPVNPIDPAQLQRFDASGTELLPGSRLPLDEGSDFRLISADAGRVAVASGTPRVLLIDAGATTAMTVASRLDLLRTAEPNLQVIDLWLRGDRLTVSDAHGRVEVLDASATDSVRTLARFADAAWYPAYLTVSGDWTAVTDDAVTARLLHFDGGGQLSETASIDVAIAGSTAVTGEPGRFAVGGVSGLWLGASLEAGSRAALRHLLDDRVRDTIELGAGLIALTPTVVYYWPVVNNPDIPPQPTTLDIAALGFTDLQDQMSRLALLDGESIAIVGRSSRVRGQAPLVKIAIASVAAGRMEPVGYLEFSRDGNDEPTALASSGTHLYVGMHQDAIAVVDATDRTKPKLVGRVEHMAGAAAITVGSGSIYAVTPDSLGIGQLQDSGLVEVRSLTPLPASGTAVELDGSTLFVGVDYQVDERLDPAIHAFDISRPIAPVPLGGLFPALVPSTVTAMVVTNGELLMATLEAGVMMLPLHRLAPWPVLLPWVNTMGG